MQELTGFKLEVSVQWKCETVQFPSYQAIQNKKEKHLISFLIIKAHKISTFTCNTMTLADIYHLYAFLLMLSLVFNKVCSQLQIKSFDNEQPQGKKKQHSYCKFITLKADKPIKYILINDLSQNNDHLKMLVNILSPRYNLKNSLLIHPLKINLSSWYNQIKSFCKHSQISMWLFSLYSWV